MQRKMYFLFAFIVLVSVSTTGLFAFNLIQESYLQSIFEKLNSDAAIIDSYLIGTDLKVGESNQTLNEVSKKIKARITLIQKDGTVFYDSESDARKMENHSNREEVRIALSGEIGIAQRYSTTLKHDLYYLAYPAKNASSEVSVIRLAVPLKEILEFKKKMMLNICLTSGIGIAVTFFIGYRMILSILRPIKVLKATAKKITDGEYSEKVHIDFGDELGDLARAFNRMTEELNIRMLEVADQNAKMNAILGNMLSVVIAVDREKRIMFMNKEAEELFDTQEADAKGKYILTVFRNSSMLEQIKDLFVTNQPSMAEVEVSGDSTRIFNVYANPIFDASLHEYSMGVVMIFQEITEIRKLENMRKDFVANVSHELKTPLTSIKGFVETLKNGAVENPAVRDRFLDIIEVEAMRLTSLINDLLVLSDIENRYEKLEKEPIYLGRLLDETILMLSETARKKPIELITQSADDIPVLYGNPSWFKQLLINLIDNGIKYTPAGGFVKISTEVVNGHILLTVEDNGIGIDKEHTSRLFERFYRVDKARSRNVGGTGLGLAIVKHIVLAYKGEIKVNSELDQGTQFIVRIPIHPNCYKQLES